MPMCGRTLFVCFMQNMIGSDKISLLVYHNRTVEASDSHYTYFLLSRRQEFRGTGP